MSSLGKKIVTLKTITLLANVKVVIQFFSSIAKKEDYFLKGFVFIHILFRGSFWIRQVIMCTVRQYYFVGHKIVRRGIMNSFFAGASQALTNSPRYCCYPSTSFRGNRGQWTPESNYVLIPIGIYDDPLLTVYFVFKLLLLM